MLCIWTGTVLYVSVRTQDCVRYIFVSPIPLDNICHLCGGFLTGTSFLECCVCGLVLCCMFLFGYRTVLYILVSPVPVDNICLLCGGFFTTSFLECCLYMDCYCNVCFCSDTGLCSYIFVSPVPLDNIAISVAVSLLLGGYQILGMVCISTVIVLYRMFLLGYRTVVSPVPLDNVCLLCGGFLTTSFLECCVYGLALYWMFLLEYMTVLDIIRLPCPSR
jgi:hypothetical protein